MRAINIRIPAAKRILDFGCGSGWFLAEAQVEGNPLRVGVDSSKESLGGHGVPMVHPDQAKLIHKIVADGLHLPFPEASFDVVVGHVSMPYMDTSAAFGEICRVLAPGGSFLLTFHNFYYLRKRLLKSLATGHWKDVAYMFYVATNGILNHFNLPQMSVWWNRKAFETVNTRRGVYNTAHKFGFVRLLPDRAGRRIFFHLTGQKPSVEGTMIPAPEPIYPG